MLKLNVSPELFSVELGLPETVKVDGSTTTRVSGEFGVVPPELAEIS